MTFKDIMNIVKEIPSTTGRKDCEAVFKLSQTVPNDGIVIETGTGNGRTTAVLALATMNRFITIITIDNYSESKRYSKNRGVWSLDYAKNIFNKFKIDKNIVIVTGNANDYLKNYSGRIDMIYLDDCHLYPVVKEEIILSKQIMMNGVIAGHDYNDWRSDGIAVSKAVNEEFINSKVNIDNTVWSVYYNKETK